MQSPPRMPWARCVITSLTGWMAAHALAAPVTCADMQARIEAQYKAKGVAPPPLKIVPKGLVAGMQVLGSCENGTQRIAYRPAEAASAAAKDKAAPPAQAAHP